MTAAHAGDGAAGRSAAPPLPFQDQDTLSPVPQLSIT